MVYLRRHYIHMQKIKDIIIEFWYFCIANARASYFGAFLLFLFLLTQNTPYLFGISRYDFIFLCAVIFQICALLFRFEKPKEFYVILIFHILATIMEVFKTHPSIASWNYPQVTHAYFALGTVPLFTGFLYSAVGSYISRAFMFLKLTYHRFPSFVHLWTLSTLIYVNFFTHHFVYDLRYVLFLYILFIFRNTRIHFQIYKKERSMPFLVSAFLTAGFLWIAENIGTFTNMWRYPNQTEYWKLVSADKVGSWFLLLILSFALVSLIYKERIRR